MNEFLLFSFFLVCNGVVATAEIALSAARKARLEPLIDEGNARAAELAALAEEPQRSLSALRLTTLTLMGVMGYFVSTVLTDMLVPVFTDVVWLQDHPIGAARFTLGIALFFSALLFCELIPRRVALSDPEKVAVRLVPVIRVVAYFVTPVLKFTAWIFRGLFRSLGLTGKPKPVAITEEEVTSLIEQGLQDGVFNKAETEMVAGVLELDQLPVTAIMTPRPKIVFLNIEDPDETNWRKVVTSGHSYFPVFQGSRDQVLGMVSVKSIWANSAIGAPTNLRNLILPPLIIPESMKAIQLLEAFKMAGKHIALVTDEFGAIQGLVTLIDVLQAIVGDLPAPGHRGPALKQREDGSWLMDGTVDLTDLKQALDLDELPQEDVADFQTLGGFIATLLGRIPETGDSLDVSGWHFVVVSMDRHRVDKVAVSRLPEVKPAQTTQPSGDEARE